MEIQARAKINWTLDILGQRADGYHLLDMLMQPITLCDTVTLEAAEDISLTMGGEPLLPADEKNLAYRAAALLKRETGFAGGAAIHVQKRIPCGAGLGGGSADAAAVLAGLNRLWGLGLAEEELERIGLRLGADVPFCLRGGLCRVGGIGEVLSPEAASPAFPLVIVQPCEGLSTKEVYQAWHQAADAVRPDTEGARIALAHGSLTELAPCLGNALQPVSVAARPQIGEAIAALRQLGAPCAMMSGSGSAVFGAFKDESTARAAAEALRQRWSRTFLCGSCAESLIL